MTYRLDVQGPDALAVGVFICGVFLMWAGRRLNSTDGRPKTSLELEL